MLKIKELQLETWCFDETFDFYSRVLGFTFSREFEDCFEMSAGYTRVIFKKAPTNSRFFYHFAFSLKSNTSLLDCIEWLAHRGVHLLKDNDKYLIDQGDQWDSYSCYFQDPSGNIVEFITRRDPVEQNRDEFTIQSVGSVCEIGLPVKHVSSSVYSICEKCGLAPFNDDKDPNFVALGSSDGFILMVDYLRPWFPAQKIPTISPTKVTIETGLHGHWVWDHKYEVFSV